MYYRTPENRRPRTSYPSDEVSVPENYGGSVFRRNDGKTTFSPLEEQAAEAEREYGPRGERAEDGSEDETGRSHARENSDGFAGGNRCGRQRRGERPDTWEGGDFPPDGEIHDEDRWEDDTDRGDCRDKRDCRDPDDRPDRCDCRDSHDCLEDCDCRDSRDHCDDRNHHAHPDCGRGKDCPGGTDTEPPSCLPKPPGFLEHFSLPHSFGSEELLLLGLMYLTAQKPDDDLWVYLLVLLFCG